MDMTHAGRWPQRTMAERFWSHVDTSGECWEWTAATRGNGYGQFYIGGRRKMIDAHRYSAMLHFGMFDKRLLVCHTCDNMTCVRPEHLFLGDHSANVQDMVAKGRAMWGGKCKRGHDLSATGVSANKGTGRRCGVCLAEYREARRAS